MSIIVKSTEQLIILSRHYYQHRPNKAWEGCLEIEKADYTYSDIMKLANDEPDTIVRVLKLGQDGIDDITDAVLDWEEANRMVKGADISSSSMQEKRDD